MNVSAPQQFSLASKPALPIPVRSRWQPLRLGMVDLFRYDSEEFWFRDGHLLLRGNNGTGKSKVLSLALPFLFDAQLKPSRIEPDGDPTKKMSWNLLLGKYEKRAGYIWIEFGRHGQDNEPHYLTLGCGLSAVAAKSHVDSWFFILEHRRVGLDLWLTSPQRTVLAKERLRDTLGDHGVVFETAASYRRAVDERLFQLGTARYSALMDTLIQLRQPQLSKKPDEASLSNALTEALPPLSTDLLGDVADALNQLEEDRRQLQEYEALLRAVGSFSERYGRYAMTQTRRQARNLRSAQTHFDTASRALNEARAELTVAGENETKAQEALETAKDALRSSRTRLDVLREDPLNREANRLELASKDASERQRDATEAERTAGEAIRKLEREARVAADRLRQREQTETELTIIRQDASEPVRTSGLEQPWNGNLLCSAAPADLANCPLSDLDIARGSLRQMLDRRRGQVAVLRQRRTELDQADLEHKAKVRFRGERADDAEAAVKRRAASDQMVEQQGRALVESWQKHLDGLQQLTVARAPMLLETLAAWVVAIEGENPAHAALHAAQQVASEQLARHSSELVSEAEDLRRQQTALEEERERLLKGEDQRPAVSSFRVEGARVDRPGAPFWQLVDFHDDIGAQARAGLEAALEASGLLDAWVSPDGSIQMTDGGAPLLDTQFVHRKEGSATLAGWLKASGSIIHAATISSLLRGIACTAADDGADESWLSPDGRFRIGALAGAWTKPVAAYIGYAARQAARTRRLDAIATQLDHLSTSRADLQRRLAEHAQRRDRAAAEWRNAPADDVLRDAHAEASARNREFQAASLRLEEAERQLSDAAQALGAARRAVMRDAGDLHLPETHEALNAVDGALGQLTETAIRLFHAGANLCRAETEYALQHQREDEAKREADESASRAAERRAKAKEAQTRFETIRESVGDAVADFQRRVGEAQNAVEEADRAREQREETRRRAGEDRAGAAQKVTAAQDALQERSGARERAVIQLQSFAATDLLAVALPEITIPDQGVPWTIDPALNLARRAEQALSRVPDDDISWRRIERELSEDYTALGSALTALGHQAQMTQSADFGLVVNVTYQNRPERPDRLKAKLEAEIGQRRELLTAREREVLENHLEAEIAAAIQRLLQDADRHVEAINKELYKRPTSTGVRFRLIWQPLSDGADGAPVGLEEARKRLLNKNADLWSLEDRRVVGAMLQQRIETERANADMSGGSLLDQLSRALDYRRWHRFTVQRWQDGQWRKLSGPASSGERALGLTVPLFAAVASFYSQSGFAYSPRLVLLDEVFAGIDDAARAHCMGLVREFDLDFIVTSEREWGCYAELPGVSICHLQRSEGIDAVHVSRWTWDGHAKRREQDPDRRFADS